MLCGGESVGPCCAGCAQDFSVVAWRAPLPPPAGCDTLLVGYEFAYPLNHAIHSLKYGHQLAWAGWFSEQLLPIVSACAALDSFDLVLGVPLHKKRLALRGFNQSHELAQALANLLQIPCRTSWCRRRYHLRPQVELSGGHRRALPEDLFVCDADLDGLHVLIVDDVATTGTTLSRLAESLLRQGARKISACVIAHATDYAIHSLGP